jgi:hypothetical protein
MVPVRGKNARLLDQRILKLPVVRRRNAVFKLVLSFSDGRKRVHEPGRISWRIGPGSRNFEQTGEIVVNTARVIVLRNWLNRSVGVRQLAPDAVVNIPVFAFSFW